MIILGPALLVLDQKQNIINPMVFSDNFLFHPVLGNPFLDFIKHLPDSEGFTTILVVVDHFTKQSIFISTHDTITSAQLAEFFVIHLFSKHGVPSHVTSDHRSEFVSHFFRSLGKALNMKLHFTSGYHLEGDGQTEHINQILEQYLQIYCNYQQDNWKSLLPLAEFSYNNAPSATTGVSPFFANQGYNPAITIHPEYELVSFYAHKFVTDLSKLYEELWKAILLSQEHYQISADKNWIPPPEFKVGDWAYVKAQFFQTTRPAKKLSEKYLGPYEIKNQAGPLSWTLCLPEGMHAIHSVFHVSMLEPSILNSILNCTQPPPPPITIDDKLEYEIFEILDSKLDNQQHVCKLLYLVKWSGYESTDEETSWLPANELGHASKFVSKFHTRYPAKPGPLLSTWHSFLFPFIRYSFYLLTSSKLSFQHHLFHLILIPILFRSLSYSHFIRNAKIFITIQENLYTIFFFFFTPCSPHCPPPCPIPVQFPFPLPCPFLFLCLH